MKLAIHATGNSRFYEDTIAVDITARDGRRFEIRETAEGAILFSEIKIESAPRKTTAQDRTCAKHYACGRTMGYPNCEDEARWK